MSDTTIGLESYDNKTKNDWRNWAWNRVVDHCLPTRPGKLPPWSKVDNREKRRLLADKTILYLCGPDDFDRDVALKHGFRNENLIAVDVNESNVVASRRSGGIGISCPIEDLLAEWPSDWSVDGVVCDMCCGMNETSLHFMSSLFISEAVRLSESFSIVANMQRGRDSSSNDIRMDVVAIMDQLADRTRKILGERKARILLKSIDDPIPDIKKNRAKQWLCILAMIENDIYASSTNVNIPYCLAASVKQSNSHFFSYKSKPSNRVVMDSVATKINLSKYSDETINRCIYSFNFSENVKLFSFKSDDIRQAIRRRIAALRAVRTMKQRESIS